MIQESLFKKWVLAVVSKIPKGQIRSYRQIAAQAGSPNAFRSVGNILNKNYNPQIPCHRIIRSDGQVGGYNRGRRQKIKRLKKEKIKF